MTNKFDTFGEIENLSSLLSPEDAEKFIQEAQEQLRQKTADEEILRNLNGVLRDLRNVLPDYEVLTADIFSSTEEIDIVTLGQNVIKFDEYQALSIPTGTRIVKNQGSFQGSHLQIQIGNGMVLYLYEKNFPKYGLRVKPKEKGPA